MDSPGPCRLFESPPEIRIIIYEALLAGVIDPKEARHLTALLRTCKKLLREAAPTFQRHCKQQQDAAQTELKIARERMYHSDVSAPHLLCRYFEYAYVEAQQFDRVCDWISLGFDVLKQEVRRGRS